MTDTDPAAARLRGPTLRQTRLARARTIRRRIIGGALALFVASWLLITIVLVSGHDPALAKRSSATTVASTPSNTATTSSSGSSSGTTTSGSSTSGSATSSVTTSQS
jgi:hypothetical protein